MRPKLAASLFANEFHCFVTRNWSYRSEIFFGVLDIGDPTIGDDNAYLVVSCELKCVNELLDDRAVLHEVEVDVVSRRNRSRHVIGNHPIGNPVAEEAIWRICSKSVAKLLVTTDVHRHPQQIRSEQRRQDKEQSNGGPESSDASRHDLSPADLPLTEQ